MDGDLRKLLPRAPGRAKRFGDIARCGDCDAVLVVHPSDDGCRHCGSRALHRY